MGTKTRSIFKRTTPMLLASSLTLTVFTCADTFADDNARLNREIAALIAAHNTALPTSLTVIPGASDAAEAITYGTNIGLKYIRAPFNTPSDVYVSPNSADKCEYQFTLPQASVEYENLLGIWDIKPVPSDWGILGAPAVYHANTGVEITVQALSDFSEDLLLNDPQQGIEGLIHTKHLNQQVSLPVGTTALQWSATTKVSTLFDWVLPVAAYGVTSIIYGKAVSKLADTSAEQAARQAKFALDAGLTLINIGTEIGLTIGGVVIPIDEPTVVHADSEHQQNVIVYDLEPPQITATSDSFVLEASDFGGALYSRNQNLISATVSAFDPCNRLVSLANDAPSLLPLGETTLTWTATDLGPNLNLQSNLVTLQQTVIVQDTQAPIMLPPPGKVIETTGGGLSVGDVSLGLPRVVDLADASPSFSSNSPDFFPINSRTQVQWQSADASGNIAEATQWITVKEEGSNTTPSADNKSASTLTSMPVDIVLSGSDADFIDGRFDPLSFRIEKRPENGEFIAPLLPYFIEDYRTRPDGPWGEDFLTTNNRNNWVYDNVCRMNMDPPQDFVYAPKFIHVTDDGTQFIIDSNWRCNPSSGTTDPRISKWDSQGNFLGDLTISDNTNEQFVIDRDGFLYTTSRSGGGSSTSLFLTRCSTDFEGSNSPCDQSWKFNYSSAPNISPEQLVYARVDSQLNLVYITDKRHVFAFSIDNPEQDLEYLGALKNGESFLTSCSPAGSSSIGFTMEIDKDSNLYIVDSCEDRIHKFGASSINSDGDFVAGDYVGWLGKCDSSSNNACDEENGRSKGYSCTDDTCSAANSEGDKVGQFSSPVHIVLDPNDTLYVADYDNRRIQRFAADGSFAGESVSTGTGINMGEQPSFILGNFDSPKTVSVNSSQFFIVDQAESFVHVFETTPLKEITDESATVSYVSNFNFHSNVDTFTYSASDGLASSSPATVSVTVNRNFRAPEAFPIAVSTDEDQSISLTLVGDDPDGVIGTNDVNPLDSLNFEIEMQPMHGSVSGSGASRVYQPTSNFYGKDSFTYFADDGALRSEPVLVEIQIDPVNDNPVIQMPEIDEVAAGFPLTLAVTFTDDNPDPSVETQHQVTIDWGDGQVSVNGNQEGEGVTVVSPLSEGVPGLIAASHVYESTGDKTIVLCVTDYQGGAACQSELINSVERTQLAMQIESSKEELQAGEEISFDIELFNLEPVSPVSGITAEEVKLSHAVPAGLEILGISSPAFSCDQIDREVSCSLGTLAAGESRTMQITARHDGSVVADTEAKLESVALTSSPGARRSFLGFASATLLADTSDSDNDGIYDAYENRDGLSVGTDDSAGDLDGDGLNNLAEFLAGTLANTRDSDGDGIDDGWEVENGFNPKLALDASADSDADGFSNLQEFLADRNPNVDEQSGDRLVPILAPFDNDTQILLAPAVQLGDKFYDLVLELKGSDPFLFELNSFSERAIQVSVPDVSSFDPQSNTLVLNLVEALGELYALEMKLVNDSPIQLQLVGSAEASVSK